MGEDRDGDGDRGRRRDQGHRRVKIGGVVVGVETFGSPSDPVVLLIGEEWADEFCARLAAGLRYVLRYDGRERQISGAESVDEAVGVLDGFGITRAHIVADGHGVGVCEVLAHRYRARVASVTVVNGADGGAVTEVLLRTSGGWEEQAERLVQRSLASGDPTGWFERLHRAAAAGEIVPPWSRTEPHPLLAQWAHSRALVGDGRAAVVVGCGLGADAEFVGSLGFDTTGFDISASAIALAKARFPGSAVHYTTADLLALPSSWLGAFDLVVEVITAQALPDPPRGRAIAAIGGLVAPGGTLLVVETMHDGVSPLPSTPPFPLSRGQIDSFAGDGLVAVLVEEVADPRPPHPLRWRAEFRRSGPGPVR